MFGKGNKIYSILRFKCPNCHEGDYYYSSNPYNLKKLGKMYSQCPVCKQQFHLEPGFYFGATYVSYAINVVIFAISWFIVSALELSIGYQVLGVSGSMFVLVPATFAFSRIIWINIFVHYQKGMSKN